MTWRKLPTPSYPSSLLLQLFVFWYHSDFLSSSLQLAQNAAAGLLTRSKNRHHITEIPASSLWLPVSCRLKLKTLFFVYTALNGLRPASICELLPPYHTVRDLRSSDQSLLSVVRSRTKCCDDRAFTADIPKL